MTHVTITHYGTTNRTICVACGLNDQHPKHTDAQTAAHQHDHDHHQEPTQ
jgi:hypothetical protein